ncbi:MAG: hypothetical protein GY847_01680 [Proteobacteria bacterium]|nr:hypothetical protein [Pseudomonadota bacterium]
MKTRNQWGECDSCPKRTEGNDVACRGCQEEAVEAIFGDDGCPACSSVNIEEAHPVSSCQSCGAIFSDSIYLGDSYLYVLPIWDAPGACQEGDERYFDFTTIGSAGRERRHGWFNPTTKKITQTG